MPTKQDNDEERDRRVDQLLEEHRKAEALSKQSATLPERARRARRQAKAELGRSQRLVPTRRKTRT